jgi:transcriptional regulator with XRE-family HTH domain
MLQRRERESVTAIGKAFKLLRKQKKMSAFTLGLQIGMSSDTVYDWENGHREIMMGNFLAICRVLGVLPSEVLKLVEAIDKPTG